jgi:hypothetical protein
MTETGAIDPRRASRVRDARLRGAALEAADRVAPLLTATAPLAVALSGGSDSATLPARALGWERVPAALGVSPGLALENAPRRAAYDEEEHHDRRCNDRQDD